jgi:hypothetical protein
LQHDAGDLKKIQVARRWHSGWLWSIHLADCRFSAKYDYYGIATLDDSPFVLSSSSRFKRLTLMPPALPGEQSRITTA